MDNKTFIVEKAMINDDFGYFQVVVEGESHLNRTVLRCDLQRFYIKSDESIEIAKSFAYKLANGLNEVDENKIKLAEEYQKYRIFAISKGRSPMGKKRYRFIRDWIEHYFSIDPLKTKRTNE